MTANEKWYFDYPVNYLYSWFIRSFEHDAFSTLICIQIISTISWLFNANIGHYATILLLSVPLSVCFCLFLSLSLSVRFPSLTYSRAS